MQRNVVCVFCSNHTCHSIKKDQTCTKVLPPPKPNFRNFHQNCSPNMSQRMCNTKCNLISLTSSLENQSSKCTDGFQQFGEKVSSVKLWESLALLSTLLGGRERERESFKLMLQRFNFPSDWETLDAKWVFAVLQYKQLLTTLEHNGSWMHHLSPLAAFSNC